MPSPDGNRGSFFPATQRRYKTPEQLQTAHDHIRYLKELTRVEAPKKPNTSCDHEFAEDNYMYHTLTCSRCGMMVEHPHKWYLERES